MKRFLITAVVLLAAAGLRAQEIRVGVVGDFNMSWLHNSVSSSDCYVGFGAGVKGEYLFSDAAADDFYIDARLIYSLKGGSWANIHQNLGYLELPILAGYRYHINSDLTLLGGLGPYFGIGVLGKQVIKTDGAKAKTDIFGKSYKRFDFGLNYSVGVEISSRWQVFLTFEHSLIDIAKSRFDTSAQPLYRRSVPLLTMRPATAAHPFDVPAQPLLIEGIRLSGSSPGKAVWDRTI